MERVIINSLLKQNKNAFVLKKIQLLSVQCILSMLWYIHPLHKDTVLLENDVLITKQDEVCQIKKK